MDMYVIGSLKLVVNRLYNGVLQLLVWLLMAAGTVEAVWGLLQVYGYEPSKHSLYALTGSFYNPGPYSGFLIYL